jgi:hypothetical protein
MSQLRTNIIIILLIFFPASFLFAQYNPVTETPLKVIDQLPGIKSNKTKQTTDENKGLSLDEDEILFDPERGIIIPEESSRDHAPLRSKEREEEYLIMQAEKQMTGKGAEAVIEIDPNKPYIERQIEELSERIKGHARTAFGFVKDVLPYVWQAVKACNFVVMSLVLFIAQLPAEISIPLFILLYGLVCYPLRKIAHTITNDEWMALIPPMQFILLLKITERSYWSLLLFLIPGVNLILMVIIFKEICELLRQPAYYGFLILIPGLNIALLWYLAYVEFD